VSIEADEAVLALFLILCRIGGCFMVMPGVSSARVPGAVRLFLSLGMSAALAPLLWQHVVPSARAKDPGVILGAIASEIVVGAALGLTGRLLLSSLQFAGTAIATMIGSSGLPSAPIDDSEPASAIVTLISLSAVAVVFLSDAHWLTVRALVGSYDTFAVGIALRDVPALTLAVGALSDGFVMALQIAAPFVAYGVLANLFFGLANKMAPHVPVFFISVPFVLSGGLMLLHLAAGDALRLFTATYGQALERW